MFSTLKQAVFGARSFGKDTYAPTTPSTACASDRDDEWVLLEEDEEQKSTESNLGSDRRETILAGLLVELEGLKQERAVNQHCFQCVARPACTIQEYLTRFSSWMGCSTEVYTIAYIYLLRLLRKQPSITVDDYSIHCLLAIALITGAKMQDDAVYTNGYYSNLTGITKKTLVRMEMDLTKGLGWNLNVTPEEYELVESQLFEAGETALTWELI
nr:cyclin U4-4 [Crypthecodinium cohnii]